MLVAVCDLRAWRCSKGTVARRARARLLFADGSTKSGTRRYHTCAAKKHIGVPKV